MTKRCSFTGSTKTSMPGIFTLRSLIASGALSSVGMRPARRSVMLPLGVERAEVGADGDVAVLEFEADAGGFEGAAADHVLQRVVAEQAEVAGAAAGADAGQHGDAAAEDADFGERVEVRRVGRFELGQAARLLRQAAEAVGDVHDDLGVVFDVEFASEFVEVHGGEVRGRRSGVRALAVRINRREISGGGKGCAALVERSHADRIRGARVGITQGSDDDDDYLRPEWGVFAGAAESVADDLSKLLPRLTAARDEVLADVQLWDTGGPVPKEKDPLDAGFFGMPDRLLAELTAARRARAKWAGSRRRPIGCRKPSTAWWCWASAGRTWARGRCSKRCATSTTTRWRRRCGMAGRGCISRATTSTTMRCST